MSVFFPTPLLDYTEKFNRQYEIEQKRIQEMQKERAEYYENKNNEYHERRRVREAQEKQAEFERLGRQEAYEQQESCLLYTSPSPRDLSTSRMPSSA